MPRLPFAACFLALILPGCPRPSTPPEAPTADAPTPPETAALPSVRPPLPPPPSPRKEPHAMTLHGVTRVDDYFWMKNRESAEVLDHLAAENAYTDAALAPTAALQTTLFAEITGRIAQDDSTVPSLLHGFWYQRRYVPGGEHPVFVRTADRPDAVEQILVDGNARAVGHDYYAAGEPEVSSDDAVVAWAEDHVGRRIYTVFFKDLATDTLRPERLEEVTGTMAWALDGKTLFYARQDPETLRSFRIYKHVLGTDPALDPLVYEEKDDTFSVYVWRTKSERYLVIGSYQSVSTEMRVLDARTPHGPLQLIQPRERDHEYSVDHLGDSFLIRTNLGAKNFRLMRAPVDRPGKEQWVEVIPHRDDTLLENVELFADWLVLAERREGLVRLRVRRHDGSEDHVLDFADAAWLASIDTNPTLESGTLRFSYQSMTTPPSIYDYDLAARTRTLRKEQPVLGGFDRTLYASERLWATTVDGTRVPISLVYRRDRRGAGPMPTVLYGYGSYGASMDASFSAARLSLLDRGMVWAIAHVRGGEDLGRAWYEEGKLTNKPNTFTDFIACAEHLRSAGWADPQRLYAMGGSAGGLLVGAVLNLRPDLWDAAVAQVPFVDVVTTMLDDTIPLTTSEYDEWGDPNDAAAFRTMLAYSPYDQVDKKPYPALLVTSGLHDSQVQYWEPTKWVAKLRDRSTGTAPILLHTNMDAGHGGKSGRFARYHEVALEYAFLLDQAGLLEASAR